MAIELPEPEIDRQRQNLRGVSDVLKIELRWPSIEAIDSLTSSNAGVNKIKHMLL